MRRPRRGVWAGRRCTRAEGDEEGALAGVQGVAAVAVRVEGLPFASGRDPEMELAGLPFQGSVRIGKKKIGPLPGPA